MNNLKRDIKALLGYGKSEAITAESLADILNTDVDTVKETIQEMIAGGIDIGEADSGYFIKIREKN